MRFMMLMIPEVYSKPVRADFHPDPEAIARMRKYNESLTKAGVLLTLDGLHPPSSGARVSFAGGKPKVIDGPFTEAKEVLGGFWMLDVKSMEEAVEWACRCPAAPGDVIEIRQVSEASDCPPESRKAAGRWTQAPPRGGNRAQSDRIQSGVAGWSLRRSRRHVPGLERADPAQVHRQPHVLRPHHHVELPTGEDLSEHRETLQQPLAGHGHPCAWARS